MSGVNKAIILGNLGQDPDVRFMPSGGAVANLSIATSEKWKDKQTGEQKEKTDWHRVVIFGNLAEIAGNYLKKGSKVYIEGKIQTRKWQNNEGIDQYTTEIVVQGFGGTMQMLDSRGQGGVVQGGGFQGQQQGGFSAGQQQQGGFSQNKPQQQGVGFNQQSGHVNPMSKNQTPRNEMSAAQKQAQDQQRMSGASSQQAQLNQQQGYKVQPQEPKIDFDDDIPF